MKNQINGKRIDPNPLRGDMEVTELVDSVFMAFNAARLSEACNLFSRKMLAPNVTVGLSLSGALTPAGLGISCVIPLIEHGFVDWIVSTGANLYHDTHFGIDLALHQGTSGVSDVELRNRGIVRIYDVFFDYSVLLSTDQFYRELLSKEPFQGEMGSAGFHNRVGRYLDQREKQLGIRGKSILAAAFRHAVPIFASAPADSSIGMSLAALRLTGKGPRIDVSRDVNESAAIVLDAKKNEGRSAVVILGGGSPKNFLLQTEPQIQEILGIEETGHDYFLQITDARPDTGGLSGATPSEAVSWGKVNPEQLPNATVCYLDCTVALPIVTAYALARAQPRIQKRLFERLDDLVERLADAHRSAQSGEFP